MNPDIRRRFPGAQEQVYLNIAAAGLVPIAVQETVAETVSDRVRGRTDKDRLREEVEDTRGAFAQLIGADADEVGITKNVSEGLNLVAASLPWEAGDNVVVCPEIEHPNNIYLWYNLGARAGVEVRAIAPEGGHLPIRSMIEAMDARTRVVTFPTVSFAPGFRTDVQPLVEGARAVGALTVVDGAQSIGAVDTDVHALGIDALAVASQKALLALYGIGFLYVRKEVADRLIPIHVARYGVDLSGAHETAYDQGPIRYLPGARRFDLGNYNYVGMKAVKASVGLISELGVERIEAHVCRLAARLASGLLELGLPVVGGEPGPHLAHIVTVGTIGGGRHYTADDPKTNDLHRHLSANGVVFALRSGVLRFSVGVYNDNGDIDRVVELARAWVESQRAARG